MHINIVGDGVFGTFLKKELSKHVVLNEDADIVILAVPSSAYEEVASKYKERHLINVSSIQEDTNEICKKYSNRVTSLHPMFGPRSPKDGRSVIVTNTNNESSKIIKLFEKIGCEIVNLINGKLITPRMHDQIMAKTHLQVFMFGQMAMTMVERAKDIPDNCLPTSFKKLKDLAEQMRDMPEGTISSIKSNKY